MVGSKVAVRLVHGQHVVVIARFHHIYRGKFRHLIFYALYRRHLLPQSFKLRGKVLEIRVINAAGVFRNRFLYPFLSVKFVIIIGIEILEHFGVVAFQLETRPLRQLFKIGSVSRYLVFQSIDSVA